MSNTTEVYLLIRPDEDGNPVRLLDRSKLSELLGDPIGSYGVRKFETGEFLLSNPDANYWPDGTAVLLGAEVIIPEPVTTQWQIRR